MSGIDPQRHHRRGERLLRWVFNERALPAPSDAPKWFIPVRAEMNQRLLMRKIEFRTIYWLVMFASAGAFWFGISALHHVNQKATEICEISITQDMSAYKRSTERAEINTGESRNLDLQSAESNRLTIRELHHLGC